jgi:hypothetical protein
MFVSSASFIFSLKSFVLRDVTQFGILNAHCPTRRSDFIALLSQNARHVTIQCCPFLDLLKNSDPNPTLVSISRILQIREDLSAYLGSIFELGDQIGHGNSGDVFKATRIFQGKSVTVALKVFRSSVPENDVRAEFAVLQRLQNL